jgi:hypothetical protein
MSNDIIIDDVAMDTSEAPTSMTAKEMRLMLHLQLKRASLANEARLKGMFVDKVFRKLGLMKYR